MSDKSRIVFVGNGKMTSNLSNYIDNSFCVIRSQRCGPEYNRKAGSKTDVLCVRPSNEPYGKETAQKKLIPTQAADDCSCLFMCVRGKDPQTAVLFANYPVLKHKPMLTLNEEPARALLIKRGAVTHKQHKSINPTLGLVLLQFAVERKFYEFHKIVCVGFAWDFGKYKEHKPDTEQLIEQEWANQGFLEFI